MQSGVVSSRKRNCITVLWHLQYETMCMWSCEVQCSGLRRLWGSIEDQADQILKCRMRDAADVAEWMRVAACCPSPLPLPATVQSLLEFARVLLCRLWL